MTTEPPTLADLAAELRSQGRLDEAAEAAARCLQRHPQHPRGLLLLGRILYQRGQYTQAVATLSLLESVMGRDETLGGILSAMEELREARRAQANPAFVTESMGRLLEEQGYLLEAVEIYRRLFLASPGGKELWDKILLLRDRLEQEGSRETQRDSIAQALEALDLWIKKQRRE